MRIGGAASLRDRAIVVAAPTKRLSIALSVDDLRALLQVMRPDADADRHARSSSTGAR